jgi:hypothetical protein
MADSLSAIFKDGLFVTKKSPNRDWAQISSKAGNHLYGIICEEFANPEVALCALIHSLAEVALCQTEKNKREKLLKHVPDAVLECIKRIEDAESDEPYEYEGEGEEEEQEEEGPGKPGEEEEEEVDVDAEVDFKAPPKPHPLHLATNQPEAPSPEEEDDDDFPMDDGDPNESTFNDNPAKPAKLAGFQKRQPKRK